VTKRIVEEVPAGNNVYDDQTPIGRPPNTPIRNRL